MLPQTSLAPGAVVCLDTGTGGDFTCRVCEVTAASSDPTRCLVLTLRTTRPSQFKVQRKGRRRKQRREKTKLRVVLTARLRDYRGFTFSRNAASSRPPAFIDQKKSAVYKSGRVVQSCTELTSCVLVEAAVLGFPSLKVRTVSVDVNQH